MHHIQAVPECLRLAEEYEYTARGQTLPVPPYTFEEHHLHASAVVFHDDTQTLAFACLERTLHLLYRNSVLSVEGSAYNPRLYLHLHRTRRNVCDGRNAVAVHIAERIEIDKVLHGLYTQFTFQQSRSLGANSTEILNIGIAGSHRIVSIIVSICFLRRRRLR